MIINYQGKRLDRHGSIWAINLSEKDGNITNLGNIHYYEEIKQGNKCNIGNNGDN